MAGEEGEEAHQQSLRAGTSAAVARCRGGCPPPAATPGNDRTCGRVHAAMLLHDRQQKGARGWEGHWAGGDEGEPLLAGALASYSSHSASMHQQSRWVEHRAHGRDDPPSEVSHAPAACCSRRRQATLWVPASWPLRQRYFNLAHEMLLALLDREAVTKAGKTQQQHCQLKQWHMSSVPLRPPAASIGCDSMYRPSCMQRCNAQPT